MTARITATRMAGKDQIELARRVAVIMGPSSGAAQAVKRYDALVSAGIGTRIIRTKTMWLVTEPFVPSPDARSVGKR